MSLLCPLNRRSPFLLTLEPTVNRNLRNLENLGYFFNLTALLLNKIQWLLLPKRLDFAVFVALLVKLYFGFV
jgi:hypothetical protein